MLNTHLSRITVAVCIAASSHQHTLAATSLGIVVGNVHLAHAAAVVGEAAPGSRPALHLTVVPPDSADDFVECLLDVGVGLGGCLEEPALELVGERLALCNHS